MKLRKFLINLDSKGIFENKDQNKNLEIKGYFELKIKIRIKEI